MLPAQNILTPNRLGYWAFVISWEHPSVFKLPFWFESLPWFVFFLQNLTCFSESQMQVCCKIKLEIIKTSFRPRKSSYGENSPQGCPPSYFLSKSFSLTLNHSDSLDSQISFALHFKTFRSAVHSPLIAFVISLAGRDSLLRMTRSPKN